VFLFLNPATIAGGVTAGKTVFGTVSGFFGGGDPENCGQQQTDLANKLSALGPETIREIANMRADFVRDGRPGPTNPYSLARDLLGGSDCQVTSPGGQQWQAASFDLIRKREAQIVAARRPTPTPTPTPTGGGSRLPAGATQFTPETPGSSGAGFDASGLLSQPTVLIIGVVLIVVLLAR